MGRGLTRRAGSAVRNGAMDVVNRGAPVNATGAWLSLRFAPRFYYAQNA